MRPPGSRPAEIGISRFRSGWRLNEEGWEALLLESVKDLPRSLAQQLQAAGLEAVDVRDVGLRGHPDDDIAQYASSRELVVLIHPSPLPSREREIARVPLAPVFGGKAALD